MEKLIYGFKYKDGSLGYHCPPTLENVTYFPPDACPIYDNPVMSYKFEVLKQMSLSNSPLDFISREEFAELFNRKKIITIKMIHEDKANAYDLIEKRRNKMMKTIARIQTTVHGMDEAMREVEKDATTAEKKRIAEISKRYVSPKVAQSAPKVKKDDLDELINMFGSLEDAMKYLESLKSKRSDAKSVEVK